MSSVQTLIVFCGQFSPSPSRRTSLDSSPKSRVKCVCRCAYKCREGSKLCQAEETGDNSSVCRIHRCLLEFLCLTVERMVHVFFSPKWKLSPFPGPIGSSLTSQVTLLPAIRVLKKKKNHQLLITIYFTLPIRLQHQSQISLVICPLGHHIQPSTLF